MLTPKDLPAAWNEGEDPQLECQPLPVLPQEWPKTSDNLVRSSSPKECEGNDPHRTRRHFVILSVVVVRGGGGGGGGGGDSSEIP